MRIFPGTSKYHRICQTIYSGSSRDTQKCSTCQFLINLFINLSTLLSIIAKCRVSFLWRQFGVDRRASLVKKISFLKYHENTTPEHRQDTTETPPRHEQHTALPNTVKTLRTHHQRATKAPTTTETQLRDHQDTSRTNTKNMLPTYYVIINVYHHHLLASPSLPSSSKEQHHHHHNNNIIAIIPSSFSSSSYFCSSTMPASSPPKILILHILTFHVRHIPTRVQVQVDMIFFNTSTKCHGYTQVSMQVCVYIYIHTYWRFGAGT